MVEVEHVSTKNIAIKDSQSDKFCPKCGGKLIYKQGKYGTVTVVCENYKDKKKFKLTSKGTCDYVTIKG